MNFLSANTPSGRIDFADDNKSTLTFWRPDVTTKPAASKLHGRLGLVLAIFLLGSWGANGWSQEFRRYKIRAAVVEYKMSGMQTGTETLYFDRWGMRETKYTQTEIKAGTIVVKQNRMTLLDGEWTYNVDLDTKTGTKIPTPFMKELTGTAKRESKDATEIGEEMLARMGGRKIGTETVLGKPCDVWEIKNLNAKSWVWQGVTLKTVVNMLGQMMTTEAVRVQDNASIPEEKVTLPKDVKITEGANPMDMLKNLRKKPGN